MILLSQNKNFSLHRTTLCIWSRKREKLNNSLFVKSSFSIFFDKEKSAVPEGRAPNACSLKATCKFQQMRPRRSNTAHRPCSIRLHRKCRQSYSRHLRSEANPTRP